MGASDSKLAFKQSIFALAGRQDIPHDDPLWHSFYTLPESAEDVSSLWSPNDIGCLTLSNKENRPPLDSQVEPSKNLETLIYVLVARLRTLQTSHVYHDDQRSTTVEILNCIRILTRMMPFIYEAQHIKEWYDRFFWQPRRPAYFWDKKNDKPGQLFDGLDYNQTFAMEDFDLVIGPPLGETLLDIVVRYLFFAGFTIPQRLNTEGTPDLEFVVKVWQTGIGSNRSIGCSKENERHQQETVRLLLALLSQFMYTPQNEIAKVNIKPLTFLTTQLDKRIVNGILCSLLNTVLKYNPNMWSVPLEMATGSNDSKKFLVTSCLQLVVVLMIYEPPVRLGTVKNQFRLSMSSLHRPDDFQFIQQGMTQILAQPVSGTFNYSLSKEKALPWAPEMISFLWELIQCNKRFRRYLVDTSGALDTTILVLYYALDSKDDPSKHGILRMCVFLLQTMSTDERYADKLNHLFRHPETLPTTMRVQNFHGSYSDFLISSIHTIIVTTKGRLESVYPALLAIIQNITPYQRHVARATCSKIVNLVDMLSKPDFLLANESNKDLLVASLEAISSLVTNNLSENRRLVEVLVASRGRFKALRELTVNDALDQLDREAQQKKDRGEAPNSQTPASLSSSFDGVRSPTASIRAPSLGDLPEDERFAIGDDDEDDGTTDQVTSGTLSRQQSEHASTHSSARDKLSEKARGKRPAISVSTVSRSTSTASLPALSLIQQPSTSQINFRPTQEWLDSWYPYLALDKILQTIQLAETKQLRFKEASVTSAHGSATTTPAASTATTTNADLPSTPAQDPSSRHGGKARQPAQLASRSTEASQAARSHASSPLQTTGDRAPAGFQWDPVTIGWYTALIWSRIYLAEAEAFHGGGGLYSATNVLLFKRSAVGKEISLRSPKGAIDAVGNSIVGRISSMSIK